jgi:dTDP-glucose 4,6-dehydratase
MILITGGAGFIGANFVYTWLNQHTETIINIDNLTYAGNLSNFNALNDAQKKQHHFIRADINDFTALQQIIQQYQPRAIIHFAAESHVDRSIDNPHSFIQTNIVGTFNLLEAARMYYHNLPEINQQAFKFIHVSTDEVYGSLNAQQPAFNENTPYAPNSPYSASKAASDHLVRSYFHTYQLPCIITHCSNNYGPYQFPEKLIPLIISNALAHKSLPIYGDGLNIRDWLHVEDHCLAIMRILEQGIIGDVYNIGGNNEKTNVDVVHTICNALDILCPRADKQSYKKLISFVKDRAGHDKRYAIDNHKIQQNLNWQPQYTFDTGIQQTIQWYLNNASWLQDIQSGEYQNNVIYN